MDASGAWEVSFYRSPVQRRWCAACRRRQQSTLVAGLIALSIKTPIVALNTFGGRARDVRKRLDATRNDATQEDFDATGRPWSEGVETELVNALLAQRERKEKREADAQAAVGREGRRRLISLGVSVVMVLAAIAAILVVQESEPGSIASLIALFVGPLLAGLAGAIFRTALSEGTRWFQAAVLGLGAGFAASLLFVAGQLATSPTRLRRAACARSPSSCASSASSPASRSTPCSPASPAGPAGHVGVERT